MLLMVSLWTNLLVLRMREESEEGLDVPIEEPIERLLEEIPAKRKPAWCRQILQEAEGHATPKGTFRESRKPQRYFGLTA